MQTLYALDLTELPGSDPIWRPGPRVDRQGFQTFPELPRDGFASPLGYWFAPAESWALVAPPLRVDVVALDELDGETLRDEDRSRDRNALRASCRARLKLAAGRADPTTPPRSLVMEIDSSVARVGVDAETWSCAADTVLIVIAQFWRFLALDRMLDELTEWTRADLTNGDMRSQIRRRRSRELHAHRRALQALILNLPDFEGLLTNPRRYLAPDRPLRIYRALESQLGLGRRRRGIDERVEVVEAVLDSLAESLNHLQAMVCQIVLEFVIIAVLVLDVALFFWDALSP